MDTEKGSLAGCGDSFFAKWFQAHFQDPTPDSGYLYTCENRHRAVWWQQYDTNNVSESMYPSLGTDKQKYHCFINEWEIKGMKDLWCYFHSKLYPIHLIP